tara:strand:- start:480 stop:1220 length:741 start_codon:yes stop_codon:yes gene_type:complete
MSKLRTISIVPTLLLISATVSQAVIITTVDDGSIREGQATTVQDGGIGANLYVRSDNSGNNDNVRKAYLKFDLTGLDADLTASATFTTTISYRAKNQNGNRTFYFYGLDSGYTPTGDELGTDWSETALTWNNAPGNDRTNNIDTGFDPSTTSLIYTAGNQYNSDVGKVYTITIPTLGDYTQADNTVTLMISWSDAVQYGFGSKENTTEAYRPTLEFTQTAVPEPSSFALMAAAMSGAFVMVRRRRR